ncbi:MAG TPA: DEAD/DEAH box helicase [Acetobacteraceae bacterium]
MTPFEALHPALRYHVVNTLGWTDLRPTQRDAIMPILAGENVLLLAPTAGGKTEAALLPLLSRMATENWQGLSALYVCPLKALLNNLEPRLRRYASFVGLRAGLWHGDIGGAARKRVLDDPPAILLTTPESLVLRLIRRIRAVCRAWPGSTRRMPSRQRASAQRCVLRGSA